MRPFGAHFIDQDTAVIDEFHFAAGIQPAHALELTSVVFSGLGVELLFHACLCLTVAANALMSSSVGLSTISW